MDDDTEREEFRRIALAENVDRAERMIGRYRVGIDDLRERIDTLHDLLGRIAKRLGEPEPEEPQ